MSMKPDETRGDAIYRYLCECAERGGPCPSNIQLKERFGLRSTGSVVRWLDRFRERGLITMERGNHARRLTVTATGARTAEMANSFRAAQIANAEIAYRPQSQQGQRNRGRGRGSLDDDVDAASPPLRRAEEDALSRRERAKLRLLAARIHVIGPASRCRAIVTVPASKPLDRATLDRAFAGDMTICCGKRSEPGCSYCAEHRRRFFVQQRDTSDRRHLEMAIPTDSVERAFYYRCRNEGLNHMQALSRIRTVRAGRNARNA